MQARRPQLAELGLFLLVVALPLVFTPFSASPFGDPKLVVLAAGTLALWTSGLEIDRRFGLWAGVWVLATIAATVAGVDPVRSLLGRSDAQGGSLLLVACCGALVTIGPGLPEDLLERGRRWFVAATTVVGAIGLIATFLPGAVDATLGTTISLIGSTTGNQLFGAALVSAGLAAALVGRGAEPPSWRTLLLVSFLALTIGSFGERSSVVLPSVAVVVVLWRARLPRNAAIPLVAAVAVGLIAWTLASPLAPRTTDTDEGAPHTAIGAQATDQDRLAVWRAMARAVPERPALGWGPGASQSAYVANATVSEIEEATRIWNDAHDLFFETLVSTGITGLVPLIVLAVVVFIRALRCPPERAWALGIGATLGAFALVEPLSALLTPLLFLFAGAAAGPVSSHPVAVRSTEHSDTSGAAVAAASAVLAAGLVLALVAITASTFERWGRVYGEQWALRRAIALQPWRTTSREHLALQLALDGRAGDRNAADEAIALIGDAVRRAPWDVNVRLWAADVHTLVDDHDGAEAWLVEQIERFPVDASTIEGIEVPDGFEAPDEGD